MLKQQKNLFLYKKNQFKMFIKEINEMLKI